ncbi:MAG: hypothetical protein BWY87_00852 [Deltaproteobacteria bacterium ADurb.Bin510]|nr:MAG: hypothetical protein BWY87_00852 [Deltaproteobacteria bacterium ADurb.Bin510]
MRVSTAWAKLKAFLRPSCSLTSLKTGTKATLTAPSAMKRLSRLGRRKATKKASARPLAPRIQAVTMSRTRPSMRLTAVRPPTVSAFLPKLFAMLTVPARTGLFTFDLPRWAAS